MTIHGSRKLSRNSLMVENHPADIAKKVIANGFTDLEGNIILRRWLESWYLYENGIYVEQPDEEFGVLLREQMSKLSYCTKDDTVKKISTTVGIQRNVSSNMQTRETLIRKDTVIPCWTDHGRADPSHLIICKNGLVDLRTGELLPHTPDLFAVNSVNITYDPNAKPKEWPKFLDSVFGGDQESKEALQLFVGYIMSNSLKQQKMLIMAGPTVSGKSTIISVLECLLSENATVPSSFESLATDKNEMWDYRHAKMIVFADESFSGPIPTQLKLSTKLKKLITGEKVSIEDKFIKSQSARLRCKLVALCNDDEMPKILNKSRALLRRLILIYTPKSFEGNEDIDLGDRLTQPRELQGILNWAIEGYQKLTKSNKLIQPKSGLPLLRDFQEKADPMLMFVNEHCVVDEEGWVIKDEFFNKYEEWYKPSKTRLTKKSVWQDLKRSLNVGNKVIVTAGRTRLSGPDRVSVYRGIRWREANEIDDEDDDGLRPFTEDEILH